MKNPYPTAYEGVLGFALGVVVILIGESLAGTAVLECLARLAQ